MNREIKFRGIDKETSKWVYGYYVGSDDGDEYILVPEDIDYDCGFIGDTVAHECIPGTVGQFTGIIDKNGRELYEGDIIKYYGHKTSEDDRTRIMECLGHVIFWGGAFILYGEETISLLPLKYSWYSSIDDIKDFIFGEDRKKKYSEEEMMVDANGTKINEDLLGFSIIGNIYENPEVYVKRRVIDKKDYEALKSKKV